MPKQVVVGVRMDDRALARLDALCRKLGLNRSAIMLLGLARLAELEGIRDEDLGEAAA
jgi:antitoxin component of RelBE/YafQ-DinJ toxin-antitoxin module